VPTAGTDQPQPCRSVALLSRVRAQNGNDRPRAPPGIPPWRVRRAIRATLFAPVLASPSCDTRLSSASFTGPLPPRSHGIAPAMRSAPSGRRVLAAQRSPPKLATEPLRYRADYHIGESHSFLYCTERVFYTIVMAEVRTYVNAGRNSSRLDPIGAARVPVSGLPAYAKGSRAPIAAGRENGRKRAAENQRAATADFPRRAARLSADRHAAARTGRAHGSHRPLRGDGILAMPEISH
jgi:hypothetical protein